MCLKHKGILLKRHLHWPDGNLLCYLVFYLGGGGLITKPDCQRGGAYQRGGLKGGGGLIEFLWYLIIYLFVFVTYTLHYFTEQRKLPFKT